MCYIIIQFLFLIILKKVKKMGRYYKPLYKPNQVFCGSEQTVIVTGWTLKSAAWPANAMGLWALQQHIRYAIAQRSNYDLTRGPLLTRSSVGSPL